MSGCAVNHDLADASGAWLTLALLAVAAEYVLLFHSGVGFVFHLFFDIFLQVKLTGPLLRSTCSFDFTHC